MYPSKILRMRFPGEIIWLILWAVCVSEERCLKSEIAIENGFFSESEFAYPLNKETKYQCKSGYVTPDGKTSGSITCLESGWSPQPTCIKIECKVPEVEENLSVTPRKDKYRVGDVLKFSCRSRLKRVGPDSVQCYDFGWSPNFPTCKEQTKQCAPPPQLLNGKVKETPKEIYEHNDLVEYVCNTRFLMKGFKKIQCVDGQWTDLPMCIEVSTQPCPPPPQIPNAQNMATTVNYQDGEKVSVVCQDNYIIQGAEEIVCRDGRWQSIPRCAAISCENPPKVENAIILNEKPRYLPGQTARYECIKPFELLGEVEVTCLDGYWSQPPRCAEPSGKCVSPPSIDNGDITSFPLPAYAPGLSVEYKCQAFYVLQGPRTVTCRNGKWSSPPKCLAPCAVSEEILRRHNIRFRWSYEKKIYSMTGDMIEFECLRGYRKKTPMHTFRAICQDGKLLYPECE
ncbi:complement factor H-related protein 5-like isoform X1 [Mustela lutreola]|uniref:complement factor H-related protein 5-like isoform X1 n=1 Tax=Mustela lutreola TaxID=9666 RepID=UPI002797C8A8|nr:complement factor H-related protein 5-like isoform X1 [Mustela lutreola]